MAEIPSFFMFIHISRIIFDMAVNADIIKNARMVILCYML